MEKDCSCGPAVRSGSLGEVNFLICNECRYLKWEPFQGLTFVSPVFEFGFQISNLNGATSLDNFLSWIKRVLLRFGRDYEIDLEWFIDCYGFDGWDELDIELEKFSADYLFGDEELVVRVLERMTRWDLPGVAEDVDGFENDIVQAQDLGRHSTQELLKGAIEDMWRELGDYMQKDLAHRLRDAFSEMDFDGTPVVVRIVSWDLEDTMGSLLDVPQVSPEIKR